MKKNAPSGTLGQTVQQAVTAAEAAIASNNPNDLNNAPSGAGIDTYCGVNGQGKALPTYFNKGTGTTFCSTFVPVYQATQNAPNKAGVLSILTAHQAQISQAATELRRCQSRLRPRPPLLLTRLRRRLLLRTRQPLGAETAMVRRATSLSTAGKTNRRDGGMGCHLG